MFFNLQLDGEGETQIVLLSWIVVGAIAGWLSGQVMKGRGFGLLGDIVVGVAGAMVAAKPRAAVYRGETAESSHSETLTP
jgi:uncharacterized membrane protein YeaQ/YmgE (transglycosylase-associated protein family)